MKKLIVGLVVGVLALGTVAGRLWWKLREVSTQVSQLQARVNDLRLAQLAAPSAPDMPVPEPVAVATSPAGEVAAAAAPAARPADKPANNALMDAVGATFATEEGRAMLLAQARMFLPRQYPGLAKELGLSAAEEEKLFDMLARHQTENSASALGMANAASMDRESVQEQQRKAMERRQANQAELTAMLGDKLPQWDEYQKTLPVRRQVEQLQTALGDNALSEAQTKPLIAALATERARIQEDRRNTPVPITGNPQERAEAGLQREVEENRRLLNVATSYLNPAQIEGYQQMLQQQEEMARALMRSMVP